MCAVYAVCVRVCVTGCSQTCVTGNPRRGHHGTETYTHRGDDHMCISPLLLHSAEATNTWRWSHLCCCYRCMCVRVYCLYSGRVYVQALDVADWLGLGIRLDPGLIRDQQTRSTHTHKLTHKAHTQHTPRHGVLSTCPHACLSHASICMLLSL